MKIEKLSENSIRCTLNRADLDSRELKISELAYGSEKAKVLFKDMIAQASYEFGFEAEDIPLMIEAIPISPDCIILIITKVEHPDELDTRFSKFAPSSAEDFDDFDDEELDDMEDFSIIDAALSLMDRHEFTSPDGDFVPFSESLAKKDKKSEGKTSKNKKSDKAKTDSETGETSDNTEITIMISFNDLSTASEAACAINNLFKGESSLHKNPVNNKYYLLINSRTMSSDVFAGICNVLTEYGQKEKFSYATTAFVNEHFEVIIKENAVKVLTTI